MPLSDPRWKRLLARLALTLLRALRLLGSGLLLAGKWVAPAFGGLFYALLRWFIFPIYKILLLLRIRISKVLASTHGFVFLAFTNRYVAHAILLGIALATISTQLQTKNATASEARHTLLYAMVTNGGDDLTEELIDPIQYQKDAHYLGPDTLAALPSIDFDYEDLEDTDAPADLTVPGNIALKPGESSTAPTLVVRTRTETYRVQSGDTLAAIAQKYQVNVGTLLWANNLTARSILQPGNALKIPPISGLLHVVKKGDTLQKIATLYQVKAEEIVSANHLPPPQTLALGDELVVPGGIPPAPPAPKPSSKPAPTTKPSSSRVAIRSDIPVSTIRNKSFDVYQELTNTGMDQRLKPPDVIATQPVQNAKLLWPTRLHLINQYYGWRHTGVDIDGDYTDPIYAAEDGVIEKAGWNTGGYGLMIFIDHENGYKTRYGHASKLFVQDGDRVKRGQVIAMVGTTGRSTGTHLHFEIYRNGRRVNPLAYIR